jgi:hypothetical protein
MFSKLVGKDAKGSGPGERLETPGTHSIDINWDNWSPPGENDGRQILLSAMYIVLTHG